jgi:hypothetical protein
MQLFDTYGKDNLVTRNAVVEAASKMRSSYLYSRRRWDPPSALGYRHMSTCITTTTTLTCVMTGLLICPFFIATIGNVPDRASIETATKMWDEGKKSIEWPKTPNLGSDTGNSDSARCCLRDLCKHLHPRAS